MIHMIGSKHSGHGQDGRRLYFKGGGGGGQVKYDNLEKLYEEQAASARLLRSVAEANLPGATQAYVGEVQNVLAPDFADRRANLAGADMASANAMERAATERNLASMGVNPSDPRFAGSMRGTQLSNAARMAAGKNLTRNEADQYQLNVAKDAVGTFTGQSNSAATQMGNAASGLGSVYANQQNQQMAQQQAQSQAVGNAVAGGLAAWSMFKDGGKVRGYGLKGVRRHADGGSVGKSYDEYAATQVAPNITSGGYKGITPAEWESAASQYRASQPAQQAPSTPAFGGGLYYDKSGAVRYVGPNDEMFGPRFISSRMSPEMRAAKLLYAGLTALPSAQMKDGGKVIERHMLGGSAGSQQGNQGFFQMQQIAPPPVAQAPQQQSSMLNPMSMASAIKTVDDIKAGGGLEGMAARNTDKIGKIAGAFDEQAGNAIQSYSRGMTMSPDQANTAAKAYVEAAQTAETPALADAYMNTAANIQAGAGGQLTAAPVAEAAITPIGEAAGAAAADAAATTAATAAAEGAAAAGAAGTAAGTAATGAAATGAAAGTAAAGTTAATTAATTGLGAAAGAIGAALPWVGAAYAVGSLLDWWNEGGQVGTQNKGMSEEEAMRRFSDAFNAGEVNDLRAGGDVPGEWRENVDTVPALLVEGEGVLNAEAMALGGEKVMEDLNAKGLALREQGITPHDIKRGIGLRGLKKRSAA